MGRRPRMVSAVFASTRSGAGGGAGAGGANGITTPNPAKAVAALAAASVSTAPSAISGQVQQHHDGVFLVLRVVVRANADGPEAESTVEPGSSRVRAPNLERDEATA